MRCAVALCKADNQCKGFNKDTRFFRFPNDSNLLQIWIQFCKRQDKINVKNARICSKHFSEDSYERNLKFELCELYTAKNQRVLKADAIPSLNLPNSTNNEAKNEIQNIRSTNKNCSNFDEDILSKNMCEGECSIDKSNTEYVGEKDIQVINPKDLVLLPPNNSSSVTSRREIGIMTDIDDRDNTILKLEEEIQRLKSDNKAIEKIFTSNQIKKLKNPKKRVTWSLEDIARGIVIHSAGARAYRLLLKKGYPLPAVSTLRAWCKKIKLEPGILKQVFMIIKKTDLTDIQKLSVLSFDEIKIKSVYLYDKANDETLKPYNYVQVAILRGLFGNWKQPIFYEYDCQMTKDKLFEIITHAENAGFPIVAMVSDLGGGNRGLHRELNISTSQTFFTNPVNNKNIYVFADVPHLIKLLRNHFVDQGFILNGKEINKSIVEKLITLTSKTDLNIAHKISMENLQLKGPQRQKVKYATKLFSHTISKAISRCGTLGKLDSENWIECAEFFKDVNDWFDCLNVRVPEEDSRDRKKAFGLCLDLQQSILDKMTKITTDLRIKGKKSLLPFQKGILITNTSLKLLFNDLRTGYNIKYILTYRLNQDVLENFFGAIRSKGGLHDHPNALEFKYRLRAYILGKNEGSLSSAGNVEQDETPDLANNETLLTEECFRELTSPSEQNESHNESLLVELDEIEYDGLENLAGYICHKLQKDEPSASTSSLNTFTWVDELSEGGLKKPSEKFMSDLQYLEQIFNNFNLDSILICKKYLSNLILKASNVDCSPKIKTLFFRSRMFFRMRVLNKERDDKSFLHKRKMSKITK